METLRIFLCCGAGMSSGFLAQQTRKAIKKRKVNATVEAKSESEIQQYINRVDVVLLGPHYDYRKETFEEIAQPYGIPVDVIPDNIYSLIDGDALLDFALNTIKKEK